MAESYRLKVTCSLLANVLEDNVRRFTLNFDGLDVLSDVEVRSTDVDNPDSFEFDISKAPGMYILTMLNVIDSISSTTLLLQDIWISNNAGVDFFPLSLHRSNSNGTKIIVPEGSPHPKWLKIIKPNTTFVFNIELPSAEDFSKRYDAKTVAEQIALCDQRIAENRALLNTLEGASELTYYRLLATKTMWEKFLD